MTHALFIDDVLSSNGLVDQQYVGRIKTQSSWKPSTQIGKLFHYVDEAEAKSSAAAPQKQPRFSAELIQPSESEN